VQPNFRRAIALVLHSQTLPIHWPRIARHRFSSLDLGVPHDLPYLEIVSQDLHADLDHTAIEPQLGVVQRLCNEMVSWKTAARRGV